MGGFGSGRPLGSSGKRKTTDLRAFDVREVARAGYLLPGHGFRWCWWRDGLQAASIWVTVGTDSLHIDYSLRDSGDGPRQVSESVRLDRTACHYGGTRAWLLCPHCLRRCAVLYIGRRPLCRQCHKLTYPSQSEDPLDRACRRSHKLFRRIGGDTLSQSPARPKGMHHATYARLLEAAWQQRLIWENSVDTLTSAIESRVAVAHARLEAVATLRSHGRSNPRPRPTKSR